LKENVRAEVAPLSHHAFALNHETGTVTYITLDVRDWFDPEEGKNGLRRRRRVLPTSTSNGEQDD
jgi:hypothetical protein